MERPLVGVSVPQCVVANVRKAYAELCAALEGQPGRYLKIAAVTGTNGKTTVTWLIRSILQHANRQTGLLGTIEYSDGLESSPATLTTPDSRTLSNRLATMLQRNTTHAAIELSSHALDQHRSAGTGLDVAIVTNVTQDHFDYHHDYESYHKSKSRIFDHLKPGGRIVLNADDPGCQKLQSRLGERPANDVTTFGLNSAADVTAEIVDESLTGSRFILSWNAENGESIEIVTRLVGRHNVANCLAAAVAAKHFGITPEEIAAGIEALEIVPGRLERIECGQPFDVFVDYAHTDDALRRCIESLKRLTQGRVICVFGAGGDRDRSKRPLLASAAAEADLAVVTSDNPRTEDPQQIIDEILCGFESTRKQPFTEPDRAKAIRWAIEHAGPNDCLLVAGKGHETEQVIGTTRIPFDDREVIRNVLYDITTPDVAGKVRISA